jgi:hypothetical protein
MANPMASLPNKTKPFIVNERSCQILKKPTRQAISIEADSIP